MKYFEVTFSANPCNETITDILSALTAEIGFESFVECEGGMQAYIQQSLFDEEALKNIITDFPIPDTEITYTITEPEDKDWNQEWEKNFFQPIVIEDRCVIHSTFHKDYPKAEYDIVIDGCDNFTTRYLISDVSSRLGKPYVYGAIQGFEGQVSVFNYGKQPRTYRDLYPDEANMLQLTPDSSVIGITPAVVGSMEANEVLKIVCGYGDVLSEKLWTIDLRTLQTYQLAF